MSLSTSKESESASHHYTQQEAEDLARRLAEAQAALAAVSQGSVDAVIDPSGPLLLAKAQKALWESERGFRAVFDGSSDALLITDRDGICLDANPAAHALAGLPLGELTGKDLGALVGIESPNLGPDQNGRSRRADRMGRSS